MRHFLDKPPWTTAARVCRLLAAGAAAVGLTVALGGCGGGAASTKTEIRFMYATGDDTFNAALKAVTDAFNAQSGKTHVRLDPLQGGSDYDTAVKTMDATGSWPALIDMRDTRTYIAAGKLAPIPAQVTALLSDKAYAAAPDGKVYTVPAGPLNGEIGLNIVYDKDYFAKHGLTAPTTYAQFIALLQAIKNNGDVPLAAAAVDAWPSDQLWKPLAAPVFAQWSSRGGFWNSVQDGQASINDLRQPLERLKTITDAYVLHGWQSTSDAQTTTLLVNHKAVMATSSAGLGRLNDIQKVDPKFQAGLFIIPDDQGKLDVLRNAVNGETADGLSISTQAQHNTAQFQAATEFLTYFYSVDAANIMEKAGAVAPNIKRSDEITRNTSIPGAADYFNLLKNPNLVWYENDPKSATFGTFDSFFRQARIEMQDGQTTIDQFVAKAQAEFTKSVK